MDVETLHAMSEYKNKMKEEIGIATENTQEYQSDENPN